MSKYPALDLNVWNELRCVRLAAQMKTMSCRHRLAKYTSFKESFKMYFILEGWVSGLNQRSAKASALRGPRVRIPPLPPSYLFLGKSQWIELSALSRWCWFESNMRTMGKKHIGINSVGVERWPWVMNVIPETDRTFKNIHRRSLCVGSTPTYLTKNIQISLFIWHSICIFAL